MAATEQPEVVYEDYSDESQLDEIIDLVTKDLSEPYSIFTYRYFINNWPQLCKRVRIVQCGNRFLAQFSQLLAGFGWWQARWRDHLPH